VPTPALPSVGTKTTFISLDDVGATLAWVGRSASNGTDVAARNHMNDNNLNGVPDGCEYERTPAGLISGPPDGAITLSDIGVVLWQAGHSCFAAPHSRPCHGGRSC
jgi:hypothetical protein